MKMTELKFGGAQPPIDGYAPGGFRIGGAFREGSTLLSRGGVADWPAASIAAVPEPASLDPLLALAGEADVLLIGAGVEIAPVPAAARDRLEAAGIGVETMSTASACRTYNVLLSEGRRVAAALIAIERERGDTPT